LNKLLYSIGSSTRQKEDFVSLLKKFKIKTLVDIRRFPTSRLDHFKKSAFKKILKEENIDYLYLGNLLGGFRRGGYENYTGSAQFLNGIEELERLAAKRTCSFMCAEKFPWRCHRRFVAKQLEKDGFKVLHILDEDRIWERDKKD